MAASYMVRSYNRIWICTATIAMILWTLREALPIAKLSKFSVIALRDVNPNDLDSLAFLVISNGIIMRKGETIQEYEQRCKDQANETARLQSCSDQLTILTERLKKSAEEIRTSRETINKGGWRNGMILL